MRRVKRGKKDRSPLQVQKAFLILVGKERTLAFLKFMLAHVPSAYACTRILYGCNEESVVNASKKLAKNDRTKKDRQTRRKITFSFIASRSDFAQTNFLIR